MKWASIYRRYLALRHGKDFEAAVAEAPEDIAVFLGICLESEREQASEVVGPLIASLADGENGDEGMTVRLAYFDLSVEFCESFREFEPAMWDDALQRGIEACCEAIELSGRLNDRPCVAFYASLLAAGFRNSGAHEQAISPQLQALEIYRALTEDEPSQYLPEVAIALSNLANAYGDLLELGAARTAFEEAVAIFRRLAHDDPDFYLPNLGRTLNNFGTTLDDLSELTMARVVHLEALGIYRTLGKGEPNVYRLDLATSLSNLGAVLRELHDLSGSRDATLESIAIYRQMAEDEPDIYRPEIAKTLVNLGNILGDLREPAPAREAFVEALAIFRDLAQVRPEAYRTDIANTLNNFGNVLHDLREFSAAREMLIEGLAVYRELAEKQPRVYLPDVAMTLNNVGIALRDLRDFGPARDAFEECLAMRRRLAVAEPTVYRPHMAGTLNNLGVVLQEIHELIPSKRAFEEALEVCRELAAVEPDVYRPEMGGTLMNLGGVLLELRDLAAARDAHGEALAILRRLAETQPAVYLPEVAAALNNLGVALQDLWELASAREAYKEALEIRRGLAATQPAVYLPDVAETLSNLGNTLGYLRELGNAREALDEALKIRRELAGQQPAVYALNVGETLINLASVLRDDDELILADIAVREALRIMWELSAAQPAVYRRLVARALNNHGAVLNGMGQLDRAREAFLEALEIYCSESMWVDAALPAANLGRLEHAVDAPDLAAEHFEKALEYLHTGLRQLRSSEHHDKFKLWIEDVATGLIEFYATTADSEARCLRLAGLFESLRRPDLLGEIEGEAARILRDIAAGRGQWAESLRACRAAFLWIQAAEEAVVFGIVRPGRPPVIRTAPRRWMTLFVWVLDQMQGLIESSELRLLIADPESYRGSVPDWTINRLMQEAFQLLPAEVQELLTAREIQTLFVAPCRLTLPFPLELLPSAGTPAGLRKVLVRVQSLQELPALLEREPDVPQGRRLVVGDPDTGIPDVPRLPHALSAARDLAGLLEQTRLAADTAFADRATRVTVLQAFQDPALALFIFSGHGSEGSLMLAGGESVSTADLDGTDWTRAPFVHLDCCSAGSTRGRGGGRFVGLPTGCLQRGASAVLASFQLLYETSSAEFSRELYTALLEGGVTLGEALLRARRTIDSRYGANPLLWATSILWGNPGIRLIPEKAGCRK